MKADWVIHNVNLATMQANTVPYGKIEQGLLAVYQGKISWLGPQQQAPKFDNASYIDGNGGWLTPGLIDCHTHLIYGGHRALEFEWRLQGQSYQQIAQQGGGIKSTVTATRQASEQTLFDSASQRLTKLLKEGVTTIEIKSGYGLDLNTELRMLHVAKALAEQFPVTIRSTYLGAHTLPPEYQHRADDYIDFICQKMLPMIANQQLADAVDVFCENIGFTIEQSKKIFSTAQQLGLPIKGHVEQLSYLGGARLVAEYYGLSADHLEYLPAADVPFLKQHNVVAVLLPGAFYFLKEQQLAPIAAMREAQLPIAIASDLNPGSSPMASLLLAMNQACVLMGITPEEALTGVTRHAAQALGLAQQKGQLKTTWDADLTLWDIDHPAQLSYSINMHLPTKIWVAGQYGLAQE